MRSRELFCAGLLRPRVYVSTGAVALLDDAALSAVLAHERQHARRRDPLRLAAGRVLARALFFLPGLGDLVERQQALAELSADETAVNDLPANRSALARAMVSFSDTAPAGGSAGVDPARVDYLLGDPPSWRFPALLCLVATSVLVLSGCGRRARRTSSRRLGHARAPLPIPSALHPRSRRHSSSVGRPRGELPSPPSAPAGTQRRATARAARLRVGRRELCGGPAAHFNPSRP